MSTKGSDSRPLYYHLSQKQRLLAWAAALGILMLFVIYSFEISRFQNMLNVGGLVKQSLLLGALAGGAAAYNYAKKIDDYIDRFKAFMFILGMVLFFAPLFGSLANRLGSFKKPEEKFYEVFEIEKIAMEGQAQSLKIEKADYFIFIFENDNLEKIRLKNLTDPPQKGDKILLEFHRGLFGWNWLELKN